MSKKRKHGLFVFAADWRAEPTLALCSEGARLLWWEMLLLMSEAEPRGYLLVNGRVPAPRELAILTRTDDSAVDTRLGELESNGVFSRARSGAIYCRRIVRDEKMARLAAVNGAKGGNPNLCKTGSITKPDNPPDNLTPKGGDKLKPNLTNPTDNSLRSSSVSRAGRAQRKPVPIPDDFVLTDKRRQFLLDRHPRSDPEAVFAHCRAHHEKSGDLFKDWDAVWRTWVLSPYPKQQMQVQPQGRFNDPMLDAADRIRERMERERRRSAGVDSSDDGYETAGRTLQ